MTICHRPTSTPSTLWGTIMALFLLMIGERAGDDICAVRNIQKEVAAFNWCSILLVYRVQNCIWNRSAPSRVRGHALHHICYGRSCLQLEEMSRGVEHVWPLMGHQSWLAATRCEQHCFMLPIKFNRVFGSNSSFIKIGILIFERSIWYLKALTSVGRMFKVLSLAIWGWGWTERERLCIGLPPHYVHCIVKTINPSSNTVEHICFLAYAWHIIVPLLSFSHVEEAPIAQFFNTEEEHICSNPMFNNDNRKNSKVHILYNMLFKKLCNILFGNTEAF